MQTSRRITNEERELVFEIAGGMPELIPLIGHIRIIAQDAKDVGYMDMLRWLKRQNLKGANFREWLKEKHDGSILQAIAFIRMKVHSDFGIKKIFAKSN
jgi:hypothetical protein